jgi:hypothetical protein
MREQKLPGMSIGARASLALILPCAACTQVSLTEESPERSRLYVGAVRLQIPETVGNLRALDVSTLGLGVGNGVFLGWRRGQYVFVPTGECQLIVIIQTPLESEHATRILEAAGSEQLCIADFAHTLPRPR